MSKRTFVLNGVNLNVEFVPGNRIEDMTERLTSHLQRTYGIDPNEQDYSHRYKEPLFHDDRRIGDRDNQQGMYGKSTVVDKAPCRKTNPPIKATNERTYFRNMESRYISR